MVVEAAVAAVVAMTAVAAVVAVTAVVAVAARAQVGGHRPAKRRVTRPTANDRRAARQWP